MNRERIDLWWEGTADCLDLRTTCLAFLYLGMGDIRVGKKIKKHCKEGRCW